MSANSSPRDTEERPELLPDLDIALPDQDGEATEDTHVKAPRG